MITGALFKLDAGGTHQWPVLQQCMKEIAARGVLTANGVASGPVVALSQQLHKHTTQHAEVAANIQVIWQGTSDGQEACLPFTCTSRHRPSKLHTTSN
jgi:hypothetical protein